MFLNFEDAGFGINLENLFLFERVDQDPDGKDVAGVVFVSTGGVPKLVAFATLEARESFLRALVSMRAPGTMPPPSSGSGLIIARPGATGPVQRR